MQSHLSLSSSSKSLGGAALQQQRPRQRCASTAPRAFFKSARKPAVEEPPAPPPKRGFFGRAAPPAAPAKKQAVTKKQPASKKQQKRSSEPLDKAAAYEQRQGALGRVISAFDFAEVRSKGDAELLYEAKYGKRDGSGKLTPEQAAALRRRVVGTAKDYWKSWVEVKGEYTDKGFVAKDRSAVAAEVPALPFLIATVLLMFTATFFVVSQTS